VYELAYGVGDLLAARYRFQLAPAPRLLSQ
jgi:hypothetical protein